MSFQLGARILSLCALTLGACVMPEPLLLPVPEIALPPTRQIDVEAIAVRLGAHENAAQLRVGGTESGSVLLSSAGSRVLTEDGVLHAKLRILPSPDEHLTVGERQYEGTFVVTSQAGSGLHVTNLVDLEAYVRGVVAGESVLWSATPVELEVQAICARSYAVATLQERLNSGVQAFLWDDTRDQVYLGAKARAAGARSGEIERKLDVAIASSKGRVLGLRGGVLDARFHAACGGTTARFRDIFGEESAAAAIPSVRCGPCATATGEEREANNWSVTASRTELAQLANKFQLGRMVESVRPIQADAHGRWLTVELSGDRAKRTISSTEFRRELGATRMNSAQVSRTWPQPGTQLVGGLYLEGCGRGHGVGLCQVGSRALARDGWTTSRILAHYYPGARLGRVDSLGHFRSPLTDYSRE